MNVGLITASMFGLMLLLLLTGFPLAFGLGAIALGFALWLWGGPASGDILIYASWGMINNFILVAIPLFVFMGVVLEGSGIADALYGAIYKWMGGVRGGLGMGTIGICAMIAAMVGTSSGGTVTMGYIALPSMVKRGYDKRMITGAVQAGGALGFLIPPSIVAILYALLARVSVGKLFAGGFGPGLMLAAFYILYIGIRCYFQRDLGPALPPEERGNLREKVSSLRGLILPAILIFAVLGSIIFGVASPTEASAVGALGALICAGIHRRLNWRLVRDAAFTTARIIGMVMWIVISAIAFSAVYDALGAVELIKILIGTAGLSPMGVLIIIQLSFFVMGCFLDDTAILFITLPIYLPLVMSLGFDPVWFGILYIINMQMAFITPPFGYTLFVMTGVVKELFRTGKIPEEITIGDVYRSVWPFVALQGLGLAMVMIFPQIAMWIPNLIFG